MHFIFIALFLQRISEDTCEPHSVGEIYFSDAANAKTWPMRLF